MKYLSIDLGEKRIGLAISDRKGIIAKPHRIIERDRDVDAVEKIADECSVEQIEHIVMGIPYSAREETQKRFRSFMRKIAAKTGLPISEWDETFSTKQAQNMVAFADSPSQKKRTKTHRDDVAAAIILQEFLDHEKSR